jgi:hypothetical protein
MSLYKITVDGESAQAGYGKMAGTRDAASRTSFRVRERSPSSVRAAQLADSARARRFSNCGVMEPVVGIMMLVGLMLCALAICRRRS